MTRIHMLALLAIGLCLPSLASAAEIVRITADNYPDILPAGKEVDAIIGDYVLRNDKIITVVADTVTDRKANMTTPRVAGCVIDLTSAEKPNDQLTAYYPTGMAFLFTEAAIETGAGATVQLVCKSEPNANGLRASVRYTLADGDSHLTVTQTYENTGSQANRIALTDMVRADTTFTKVPKGDTNLYWVHDEWFRQAYGLRTEVFTMDSQSDNRRSTIHYRNGNGGERTVSIPAGEKVVITSQLFCADSLLALKGYASHLSKVEVKPVTITVRQANGQVVPHAELTVTQGDQLAGKARTDKDGVAEFLIPEGEYAVELSAIGHNSLKLAIAVKGASPFEFNFADVAPVLDVSVKEKGGPVPCKLQFQGIDGTKDPWFGPNTQGPGVNNLYYSHNGTFQTVVPPGKYRVLISRGPEYDLVTTTVEMKAGETTKLEAELVHSVQSQGWVSSDPHNHSTPSGDNVTDMRARVLNILAEQLDFVPCTEHNRINSYVPDLEALGCRHLLATCTGMELTGTTLPLNHQNAFPLVMKPGLQDNGAPQVDPDPELQIRRLATWDNNSEKYVHTNHPDLGWMYFDRDGDGERDAGFYRMFAFQDAIEVWGNSQTSSYEERILAMDPTTERGQNDRLFNWLQLLNQGYHIVGVANTDAHYSDHGSGWIRNYVKASTDDLTKLDHMEMVREYERGHLVLSTGPFLETALMTDDASYLPGDSVDLKDKSAKLSIKVQCPNWFDINRVQVLVNGRPLPELNFTRTSHPDLFSDEVVRFEHSLAIKLDKDAHLIVVATGEGLTFGDVFGPVLAKAPPTAIANPFFIDVDGNGFNANGDTLGHPLPVKAGTRKQVQRQIRGAIKKATGG